MTNEKLQDDPVADAVKSIMTDEQETPTAEAEPTPEAEPVHGNYLRQRESGNGTERSGRRAGSGKRTRTGK